jgi:hypothetical protein
MIDGVTILATETINKPAPWVETLGYGFAVAMGCGFLLIVLFMFFDLDWLLNIGTSIFICAAGLGLITCLLVNSITVPDYTAYEVILDDSVSMNEFMNTYEVLEQRGQIYVVKEIKE